MNEEVAALHREEIKDCFKSNAESVFTALRRVTQGDEELAADVVQDAFRIAWEKWPELRRMEDRQRCSWLMTTAVHRAIDVFRHNGVARDHETDLLERFQLPEPDISRQVLTSIAVERFIEVINDMPQQRARVAWLYFRCEYRNHEIAALLGISAGRVSQQVSAARTTLRKELGPYVPFEADEPEGEA